MDAGERHKISMSETKRLIIHSNRIDEINNIVFVSYFSPSSHREMQKNKQVVPTLVVGFTTEEKY